MIEFRAVTQSPLQGFTAAAPDGAVIGIIGEMGAGKSVLLRLASGEATPTSGEVIAGAVRRYIGFGDALNLAPADALALEHAFAPHDALVRARAVVELDRLRAGGTTILMVSHEPDLLRSLADEIWWLELGRLRERGHPAQVLTNFQRHITAKFRAWGETLSVPLSPSLRRGDGRAEILALETLGQDGIPTIVLQSGEPASIRVQVRYRDRVENPVIGIMIRTRFGFEVYGTNTELEQLALGPVGAGETLTLTFAFRCDLCPNQYTLTVASHDPDGVPHDWLDDAIAFSVADSRYTAGVANLRTRVTTTRTS
jgi:ABC-type molybdate transport system ATPase subunit